MHVAGMGRWRRRHPAGPFGMRYRAEPDDGDGEPREFGSGDNGTSSAATPLRVVIADDNPDLRMLLRTLISFEDDLDVVGEAEDGRQAVELVRETAPDLVVLDLAMPELDGLEVLERLEIRDGRPRVLVYTGFAAPDVERAARELGAADVVVKGADPTLLIDRLRGVGAGA